MRPDLIERLRRFAESNARTSKATAAVLTEAADAIEELQRERDDPKETILAALDEFFPHMARNTRGVASIDGSKFASAALDMSDLLSEEPPP